ncbi:hypothetical protein ROG8370_03975 [Roseovarius gaetbuli]|uniref:NAD-specific glutamate dehydrogenase n=1 Tax=Roseovarius gaetbuli TaxID=1356575 RepID=A0A1X7AE33_9RHOB|nr:hypothetical protein ROG8370_03975 [Roseovarius gaetbuli]
MTATFILGQDIGFGFELGVRVNRLRLTQNLTTLNSLTVDTAQQNTNVIASLTTIQQLAEHFNAGTGGFLGVADAHDLKFVANVDNATLDTTGHNRATARDREHVFDRHQERQVNGTCRGRDVLIHGRHQLADRFFADFRLGAVHRMQSRARNDRDVVAGVVIRRQKLADFHFHQFQQLFVVNLVNLVHVDDHVGDTHLATQQDVLAGLGHRAVGRVHNQDRAVHLRRTGDHVLHIVSVAGAVDVRIVTALGLIFNVGGRNRDPACLFFRRAVDLIIGFEIAEVFRDRSRQRRLAVVNVTNGADVYVRF